MRAQSCYRRKRPCNRTHIHMYILNLNQWPEKCFKAAAMCGSCLSCIYISSAAVGHIAICPGHNMVSPSIDLRETGNEQWTGSALLSEYRWYNAKKLEKTSKSSLWNHNNELNRRHCQSVGYFFVFVTNNKWILIFCSERRRAWIWNDATKDLDESRSVTDKRVVETDSQVA